jgi:hypothetical protein
MVMLLLGGALAVSVTLRNRAIGSGQPAGNPIPVPASPSPQVTASATAAATATNQAGPPPCDGSMLTARFTDLSGAAGTEGGDIVLHNRGAVACTMQGYTNIQGVSDGKVVQLGVTHSAGGSVLNNNNGTLPTVKLLTLQPGQDAYVAVEYSGVTTGPTACPSFTTLLITPPQSQQAVTMAPSPIMLCGGYGASVWIDEAPVSTTAYFAR